MSHDDADNIAERYGYRPHGQVDSQQYNHQQCQQTTENNTSPHSCILAYCYWLTANCQQLVSYNNAAEAILLYRDAKFAGSRRADGRDGMVCLHRNATVPHYIHRPHAGGMPSTDYSHDDLTATPCNPNRGRWSSVTSRHQTLLLFQAPSRKAVTANRSDRLLPTDTVHQHPAASDLSCYGRQAYTIQSLPPCQQ